MACSSIVTYISEIKILWVLNRRIKQIDNRDFIKFHRSNYEHANIICFNDTSLTWVVALSEVPFNISEICSNRLVSNSKITQLGPLLEYSSITSLEEVFESLNFSVRKIIGTILKLYQVYYVKSVERIKYLLNIHQTIAGCCEIDHLFQANNQGKLKELEPLKRKKKASEKSTGLEMPKGSIGHSSIFSKFFTIPNVATEFLMINGLKAQEKRHDDDF